MKTFWKIFAVWMMIVGITLLRSLIFGKGPSSASTIVFLVLLSLAWFFVAIKIYNLPETKSKQTIIDRILFAAIGLAFILISFVTFLFLSRFGELTTVLQIVKDNFLGSLLDLSLFISGIVLFVKSIV